MIWRWNKALHYWWSPDGNGGEWRIYPVCDCWPTFLDHFISCGHPSRAVVRVGSFADIDLARAEVEKRQAQIDARRAASQSVR